jgi:hypothetical protein
MSLVVYHGTLYTIMRELAVPFRALYWLPGLLCFVAKQYYPVDFFVHKHLAAVPDGFLSTLAFLMYRRVLPDSPYLPSACDEFGTNLVSYM